MPLQAFSIPHSWDPLFIHAAPLPSLREAHTSICHQLSLLDCRGHDARDMQRTLNYIVAELDVRANENGSTQLPASQYVQQMYDADAQWERDHGDNPRWGEGRAAHHRNTKAGSRLRRLVARVQRGAMQAHTETAPEDLPKHTASQG